MRNRQGNTLAGRRNKGCDPDCKLDRFHFGKSLRNLSNTLDIADREVAL